MGIRRIEVYANADFGGPPKRVIVNDRYHKDISALHSELSQRLRLRNGGVRNVFTPSGGTHITHLDQLNDRGQYVCNHTSHFTKGPYGDTSLRWGLSTRVRRLQETKGISILRSNAFLNRTGYHKERRATDADRLEHLLTASTRRPLLVQIYRNGDFGRVPLKVLLNRRTMQTFEQVLDSITSVAKLPTGAVRKLYTLDGARIDSFSKFVDGDCAYVACGNEKFRNIDYASSGKGATQFRPTQPQNASFMAGTKAAKARTVAGSDASSHGRFQMKTQRSVVSGGTIVLKQGDVAERVVGQVQNEIERQRKNQHRQQSKTTDMINARKHNRDAADEMLNNIKEDDERLASTLEGDKSRQLEDLQARINNRRYGMELSEEVFQERFTIMGKIGSGAFAEVKRCVDNHTLKHFAVKIIDTTDADTRDRERIASELETMRNLEKHQNLLGIHFVAEYDDQQFIVMDFITGGDLFDMVASKSFFSERDAADIIKGVVTGLAVMHDKNICHRDIKPENVLVETAPSFRRRDTYNGIGDGDDAAEPTAMRVVVGDFGLATTVPVEGIKDFAGTPPYMAPEIFEGCGYGTKADMWSVGCVLYILLCGYPPFADNDEEKLMQSIQSEDFELDSAAWSSITEDAKDTVRRLLTKDPDQRLSAKDFLAIDWVKNNAPNTTNLSDTVRENLSVNFAVKRKWVNAFYGLNAAKRFTDGIARQE